MIQDSGFKSKLKVVIWLFILITFFFSLNSIYKIVTTFAPDFSVFYGSSFNATHGISVYTGNNIFTGFGYPIVTAIPYIPFLLFPYQISQGLFVFLSFLAIPIIVFLSFKILNQKLSLIIILITSALIFISFPTKFTLGMGQSNLLVYALLLYSFYLLNKIKIRSSHPGKSAWADASRILSGFWTSQNDNSAIAGVLFGICFIIKPVLAFLILYFLLYRKWKFLSYAFLIVFFGFTCSVLFFKQGLSDYYFYFHTFLPHILGQSGREIYYNQGISGFVSRIIPNLSFRTIITLSLDLLLVTYLINLVLRNKVKHVAGFALFLAALPLVDSLSWQHHFVFLIFPFIYLVIQFTSSFWPASPKRQRGELVQNHPSTLSVRSPRLNRGSGKKWILDASAFSGLTRMTKKSTSNFIFITIIFVSYILISLNIKDPTPFYSFPFSLILSHVFFGAVLLFILLVSISIKVKPVKTRR